MRHRIAIVAVFLCLLASGCGDKPETKPLPEPTVGAVAGAARPASDAPDAAESDAAPPPALDDSAEEADASEFDAYLKQYVAPYGCLTAYSDSWTDASALGADRLVEAALQIGFRYYRSAYDYSDLYGDAFLRLQVPEAWADANYGCVYPQDQIENITIEYFGVDGELTRTSQYYLPAKSGYAVSTEEPVADELLPVITGVRRSGTRAEITFDLKRPDSSGKPAGDAVLTKVMTVEDKTESFRYLAVVNQSS